MKHTALILSLLCSTPALAAAPTAAEVGAQAADFELKDLDGKTTKLSDFRGKTVVLEWFNPGCPFVVYAHKDGPLKAMAAEAKDDVVWLAINSSAPGKQGHGLEVNQMTAKTGRWTIPFF